MKVVKLILVSFLMSQTAFGNCDWSQIKDNGNGTYTYSKELHLCVGKLVEDDKVKDQQIVDYQKAISLKDLAIKQSDDRANLWMNTSGQLEDRLQKVDSLEKKNDWLFFGLGVLATIGAGYAASQVYRH